MSVRSLLSPFAYLSAGLLSAGGVVAVGCPVEADDDDTAGVGDDDDAVDDDDATDDDDVVPEHEGTVSAQVQDPDGNVITGFKVTLCAKVCVDADSDDDGNVYWDNVAPNLYVLENLFAPNGDPITGWSRFFVFVDVAEDAQVVLEDPLIVPRVSDTQTELTGAQEIQTQDGLFVRFDADNVESSPFLADQIAFGAVALPPEQWPTPGEGAMPAEYTIHGAWALSVWDQVGEDEFHASALLNEAIPEGRVPLWLTADYELAVFEGEWHEEPAEFDEGDRAFVNTTEADGLDRTTMWMVASRPE